MISGAPQPQRLHFRMSRNAAGRNIEEVEFATLERIDWFNNRRLFGPIRDIPPAEREELYHASNEAPAMMVGPT